MNVGYVLSHNCDMLRKYLSIIKSIRYLKETLSVPLALVLINNFFGLYTTLSYFLQLESQAIDKARIAEVSVNALICLTNFICLTLMSSRIPEELSEVKTIAGVLIQKHKIKTKQKDEVLFLLNRIEKSEIIHLTACGFVEFERSFILSAIGIVLTYGLLVFNLK
ncbi:hypothetical protein JTE90_009470 [Oedothorax gibbosus]|uniref:Gustatory receptor n=1 Tax=Oedothorax gibbosus TaxID=931172 RepID=A0AAV6VSI6_9ARAC|nr:hypothetical protein JTE90_009470 [Oedothorax gibbosus]